jgi:site-specific DNA-methyltransferase (adenine-specific)
MGDDYRPTPLVGTPGYGRSGNFSNKDPGSLPLDLRDAEARRYEGFGSALKPAHEVWWLVRRPLSGPIAEHVLRFGTGTLNIDGYRNPPAHCEDRGTDGAEESPDTCATGPEFPPLIAQGQGTYPHLFLIPKASRKDRNRGINGEIDIPAQVRVFTGQTETLAPSDAIAGSAGERSTAGPIANNHPTVKPIDLMRWLVRLITPRGALVLDPFAGSGTTGVAAHFEGCDYVLIEQEPKAADIARARLGVS